MAIVTPSAAVQERGLVLARVFEEAEDARAADLPTELLQHILSYVPWDGEDRVQMGRVCRTWRQAASLEADCDLAVWDQLIQDLLVQQRIDKVFAERLLDRTVSSPEQEVGSEIFIRRALRRISTPLSSRDLWEKAVAHLIALPARGEGALLSAARAILSRDILAVSTRYTSLLGQAQSRPLLWKIPEFVRLAADQWGATVVALIPQPSELLADRGFVRWVLSRSSTLFRHVSEEIRGDFRMVQEALNVDGANIQFASVDLRANRLLALQAVRNRGDALRFLAEDLKNDPEIVMVAVRQWGPSLQFASAAMQDCEEIVQAAIEESDFSLQHASIRLRSDPDFVGRMVRICARALSHARGPALADRPVVLSAVSRAGWLLQYAAEPLKNDFEIVLAAVTQLGYALAHASTDMRWNREIVLAAVRQNREAAVYAWPRTKDSVNTRSLHC